MLVVWFLANVIALSFALAILEVFIEKQNGWATGFGPFWGKKYFQDGWVAKLCEKHYLTRYHLMMFCLVVPLVLYGEHRWLKIAPLTLIAAWIEIMVVEDFLWFAINWHFQGSLRKLFAGQIWWHTVYWKIGKVRLPRFYFLSSIWATVCLLLQYHLAG